MSDSWLSEFTVNAPPIIFDEDPAPLAIDIPSTSNIFFKLQDSDGIDTTTLTVQVDRGSGFEDAILNGVFQAGYTGTITPVGLDIWVDIDPDFDFPSVTVISVRVVVDDNHPTAPATLDTTYTFTIADEAGPFIVDHVPACFTYNNPNNTNISFFIGDDGTGVDGTTLQVFIDIGTGPLLAYDGGGGGFQPGFQGAGSAVIPVGGGFQVIIDPETDLPDGIISIRIEADDLASPTPNHTTFSCWFSTAEGPEVNKYRIATSNPFEEGKINAFQLYTRLFIEDTIRAVGQKALTALTQNQDGGYELPGPGSLFQSLKLTDGGGNTLNIEVAGASAGGSTLISGFVPRRSPPLSEDYDEQAGSFLISQTDLAMIPFENAAATTYYVGLPIVLRPSESASNPRLGIFEYVKERAVIGWKVAPTAVVDNGNGTITLDIPTNVNTALGQRSLAGRTATVYLLAPVADTGSAIQSGTITFSGSTNQVTVPQLGQPNPPSTTANAYEIIVDGPLITEVDISAYDGVAFIGTIVGVTKSTNHDGQNSDTVSAYILKRDVLRFIEPSTNTDGVRAAKVSVNAKLGEGPNENQIEVLDENGVVVFSVDEQGNVTFAGAVTDPAVAAHIANDTGPNHRHLASGIWDSTLAQDVQTTLDGIANYLGGPNWADGTTNPARTFEAQIDDMITQLATLGGVSGGGTAKIGGRLHSGPTSIPIDRLDNQLDTLLGFANTININKVNKTGDTMLGDLVPQTSGVQALGSSILRFDAFIAELDVTAAVSTIAPSLNETYNLGASSQRWLNGWFGTIHTNNAVAGSFGNVDIDGIASNFRLEHQGSGSEFSLLGLLGHASANEIYIQGFPNVGPGATTAGLALWAGGNGEGYVHLGGRHVMLGRYCDGMDGLDYVSFSTTALTGLSPGQLGFANNVTLNNAHASNAIAVGDYIIGVESLAGQASMVFSHANVTGANQCQFAIYNAGGGAFSGTPITGNMLVLKRGASSPAYPP